MWKRIITILLVIVTLSIGAMPFLELCHGVDPEYGEFHIMFHEYVAFVILIVVAFILSAIALMSLKKTYFLMRTCILDAIILAALEIWIFIAVFSAPGHCTLSPATLIPLACIVMLVICAKRSTRI